MIGHGRLLRVVFFIRAIRGSGMSIVRVTLNVVNNDFADFSINSQPIFRSWGDYPENFIEKYCIHKKLVNLTCGK